MSDNKFIILGIKSGPDKNGRMGYNYFIERPFEEWEAQRYTVLGMKCDVLFSRVYINCKPGDVIEPIWDIREFNGVRQAILAGGKVVNSKTV